MEPHPPMPSSGERKFLWELNRGKLSTSQKYVAREELWTMFPHECFLCTIPLRKEELHLSADLHHLLSPRAEAVNFLQNMRLAHHSCNARKRSPTTPTPSDIQTEREKTLDQKDATVLLREVVDYGAGSPEMQVNGNAEVPYGNWLRTEVKLNKRILKKEAINGGAFWVGVSTQATRRYLDKLTSDLGPFEEFTENGRKFIILREK